MREKQNTLERDLRTEQFFDVSEDYYLKQVIEDSISAATSISSLNKIFLEREGRPEEYLPIDVMSSTNDKYIALNTYGPNSLEYALASDMQREDASRLVDEVFNAKTFRLREPLFQDYDYLKKEYFSMGKSHKEMVSRGLSPYCNPEELRIRQIEFMEEELCSSLQESLQGSDVQLLNIKECPDWAIEAYENGERNTGGYVPSENKFVIQSFKFVEGGRIYQQASIPGNNISHQDILDVLSDLSNKEILGSRLDVRTKYFVSEINLVELIELLDRKASERLGKNIYLGDESHEEVNTYERVSEISNINKVNQEKITTKIVGILDEMHEHKINPLIAADVLDRFVSDEIIENYFDDKKIIKGTYGVSFINMTKKDFINSDKVNIEYCGAGSCGISRTDQSTPQAAKARSAGLKGEIGYFNQGICAVCNNAGFYVGINGKYCDKCKSSDLRD